MKLMRVMGELALAGGAIAGLLWISSPKLSLSKAQQPVNSTLVQLSHASGVLGLAKLVGIAQFVKAPTQYSFVCEKGPGNVTSASLEGDLLIIKYTYPADDEVRMGELVGNVDSDGIFTGTYSTRSQTGVLEGDISLTFAADGTATGHYDQGTISTHIVL